MKMCPSSRKISHPSRLRKCRIRSGPHPISDPAVLSALPSRSWKKCSSARSSSSNSSSRSSSNNSSRIRRNRAPCRRAVQIFKVKFASQIHENAPLRVRGCPECLERKFLLFRCQLRLHLDRNTRRARTHHRKRHSKYSISRQYAKSHGPHCGANQHH